MTVATRDSTQSLGCAYLKSGKLGMTVAGMAHSFSIPLRFTRNDSPFFESARDDNFITVIPSDVRSRGIHRLNACLPARQPSRQGFTQVFFGPLGRPSGAVHPRPAATPASAGIFITSSLLPDSSYLPQGDIAVVGVGHFAGFVSGFAAYGAIAYFAFEHGVVVGAGAAKLFAGDDVTDVDEGYGEAERDQNNGEHG